MIEVRWVLTDNPPFYKSDKVCYSTFSDTQELSEWLDEMYLAYGESFMTVEIEAGWWMFQPV